MSQERDEYILKNCYEEREEPLDCERCTNFGGCCLDCQYRQGCPSKCAAESAHQALELKTDEEFADLLDEREEENNYLSFAAERIRRISAQAAALRRAVEWMKTTGEYFRYKAPEQIDGNRLVAVMFATAEDALGKAATAGAALKEVPPCSE